MEVTTGFKVTDKNMRCREFQFELNKRFTQSGNLVICDNGFHFCKKPNHCFNYYDFDLSNRVFEIKAYGEVETKDDKSCCLEIEFVREIPWNEVLQIVNFGINNTGHSNTGDRNTGDRNTGDSNTGYRNTGDSNTGDRNTGDRNTGYSNTGDSNTGYRNTGDRNTGDRNTGYRNTGDRNTGNRNTGDSNTGDRNTGNSNTGYSNTGNRNTGAFCTGEPPFTMFNKPSEWTADDFLNSKAWRLICDIETKIWVNESQMTKAEKEKHYGYKTTGGFYKDVPYKEAFTNAWHNWSKSSKEAFTTLPNFDAAIFEEITGVRV